MQNPGRNRLKTGNLLRRRLNLQKGISSPKTNQSMPEHVYGDRVSNTEFDIFATIHVQWSTLDTNETAYKHTASVDQRDLEFLIPANHDRYIDLNIHVYIRGKFTKADGA
jgi:hypothetical protein